ncbi:hypothetical protein F4781DRAFT_81181 [Annulohypoxylon bovei var. microspora]|nr:hypothetical protein F4781DRAFT_81181 [Annulohypoxylon bovei var. microspora]
MACLPGMAPTAPPLSTFQVRQPLPPPNPNPPVIPTPSYEDLDRLFQSERYQSQYLKSVQMWQAPVFNEALYDGWPTAYHSQISNWDQWLQYEKKLVQVREQDWFECFKKPRWFDLRRNILLGVKNPVPDLVINYTNGLTWWTVDNPVLWGYISQAIEIACRLLRQLCLEQSEWCVPPYFHHI